MSESTNPYRPPKTREPQERFPSTRDAEVSEEDLRAESTNQNIDYLLLALLTIPGVLVAIGAVLNTLRKLL